MNRPSLTVDLGVKALKYRELSDINDILLCALSCEHATLESEEIKGPLKSYHSAEFA